MTLYLMSFSHVLSQKLHIFSMLTTLGSLMTSLITVTLRCSTNKAFSSIAVDEFHLLTERLIAAWPKSSKGQQLLWNASLG